MVFIYRRYRFLLFRLNQWRAKSWKELAQINRDIENDIRDIHILEADWSELNNPERLKVLAGKYISLDFIKPEQIINYSALPLEGEIIENPTMFAKNSRGLRRLANSER